MPRIVQHERLRAGLNVVPLGRTEVPPRPVPTVPPTLDQLARRHEGELPIGYDARELPGCDDLYPSALHIRTVGIWLIVCAGAFLTGYSLGGLIVEAWIR